MYTHGETQRWEEWLCWKDIHQCSDMHSNNRCIWSAAPVARVQFSDIECRGKDEVIPQIEKRDPRGEEGRWKSTRSCEKWTGWGWSNTLALKALWGKFSFFIDPVLCLTPSGYCFTSFLSCLFTNFLCKISLDPHQGRLLVCSNHNFSPKPHATVYFHLHSTTGKGLYELVSVWNVGGGKGGGWNKLVWEQVVRWQAENDVVQVWDCMICCHHHHIHETVWHHLLLTRPMSMGRATGWKKVCEKRELHFSSH